MNCTFRNNQYVVGAAHHGAGSALLIWKKCNPLIYRCNFYENDSGDANEENYAGAIGILGSTITAEDMGGILSGEMPNPTIDQCTFVSNTAGC